MKKLFSLLCATLMSVGMFAQADKTVMYVNFPTLNCPEHIEVAGTFEGEKWGMEALANKNWWATQTTINEKYFYTTAKDVFKFRSTDNNNIVLCKYIAEEDKWVQAIFKCKDFEVVSFKGQMTRLVDDYDISDPGKYAWKEGMPEPEPEKTKVVFTANDKTKEVKVVLPHTFLCEFEDEDGELDAIIRELYSLTYGGYCEEGAPAATGNAAVTAGLDGDNHFITISEDFEGEAIVSGKYYKFTEDRNIVSNAAYEPFDYAITVSINTSTAISNTVVEAKAVKRIVNGQLLIERDGKFFNAVGTEVR